MEEEMTRTGTLILAAACCVATAACSDAQRAHFGALGASAHVVCFSGGKLVADDYSTGKVSNAGNSDGYEFKSVTTRRLRQVSGDCQIDYGAAQPANWKPVFPA
jgi:hypothetical protein